MFFRTIYPQQNKVKFKSDLSNYTIKSDLKTATGVDTSDFAKEAGLAGLKTAVDILDIDYLKKFTKWFKQLEK